MPMGKDIPCKYNQPRDLQQRLAHASDYVRECRDSGSDRDGEQQSKSTRPLLVDGIEDPFLRTYAAWPERFFIIRNGHMELIGTPDENKGHLITEIRQCLIDHGDRRQVTAAAMAATAVAIDERNATNQREL
eukprot:TRINITY_DN3962_c1_g1_i1.p2 TRINITY_DN3962_c1_g1~~TRINITY_DN3962_c1_g1_i1.p2  ORF type:complete len:132 (-),score=25.36 TRINITY_DN3962_c1_g1_i1:203-598(-)